MHVHRHRHPYTLQVACSCNGDSSENQHFRSINNITVDVGIILKGRIMLKILSSFCFSSHIHIVLFTHYFTIIHPLLAFNLH